MHFERGDALIALQLARHERMIAMPSGETNMPESKST